MLQTLTGILGQGPSWLDHGGLKNFCMKLPHLEDLHTYASNLYFLSKQTFVQVFIPFHM